MTNWLAGATVLLNTVFLLAGPATIANADAGVVPIAAQAPARMDTAVFEPVTLLYEPRKPYSYFDGKSVVGSDVVPVLEAMTQAGIPVRWQSTPPQQQLLAIEANKARLCAIAWFDTPERRAYSQVSVPINQDDQYLLVARAGDLRFRDPVSLNWLLTQPMHMAYSYNVSYGSQLDNLIQTQRLPALSFRGDDTELLANVLRSRADYALILSREVNAVLQNVVSKRAQLQTHSISDFPAPGWNHLLCTKMIDSASMQAINTALTRVVGAAQP